MAVVMKNIRAIEEFLPCRTPADWIRCACDNLDVLLIDHAHCEKKAAATAISLMFRYPGYDALLDVLSPLAREEMLHFEQVLAMMRDRGVRYRHMEASRYVAALRRQARQREPGRLIDLLIIGAIVEARSCERFAALAGHVDDDLSRYYRFLLRSESRHFEEYLGLARQYADESIAGRISFFLSIEQVLIESTDSVFRFHSGIPQTTSAVVQY